MTGKQRMLKTLRFEQPDRPPHFEVMFELEKEAFGLQFPDRKVWATVTGGEKARLIGQCMAIYEKIVARYGWDALAVYWPWSDPDGVRAAKATFGDDILIGSIVGNTVWSIENIHDWIGTGAACFQSVDPMAGMDIAAVKRRCHGKMALMGNVQCNLLQDGPEEAIRRSARYCPPVPAAATSSPPPTPSSLACRWPITRSCSTNTTGSARRHPAHETPCRLRSHGVRLGSTSS